MNEQNTIITQHEKPFYKKWWGVLLTLFFFPIIVPYLVWAKTNWNKWVKVAITSVCALFLLFVFIPLDEEYEAQNHAVQSTDTYEATEQKEVLVVDDDSSSVEEKEIEEETESVSEPEVKGMETVAPQKHISATPQPEVQGMETVEPTLTPTVQPTPTPAPKQTPTPAPIVNENEPPVKMSSSGICHARGSTYYDRTTNFTAYNTVDACLDAGGRLPKR